jgi:hypothetical protein
VSRHAPLAVLVMALAWTLVGCGGSSAPPTPTLDPAKGLVVGTVVVGEHAYQSLTDQGRQVVVQLLRRDAAGLAVSNPCVNPGSDGQFRLEGVAPGRYALAAADGTSPYPASFQNCASAKPLPIPEFNVTAGHATDLGKVDVAAP